MLKSLRKKEMPFFYSVQFSAAAGPLTDPVLPSPLSLRLGTPGARLMHFFPPPMIWPGEPYEALFDKALASEDPTRGRREKQAF